MQPVTKTFGGALWLVDACDDGRSLALITPKESKAFLFFSVISPDADSPYQLGGEGTAEAVTDAAKVELEGLMQPEIGQLRKEATAQGKRLVCLARK